MTLVEGILGMLASVIAILGGMAYAVNFLVHRFDKWADSIVENTTAMRALTDRVRKLEMRYNDH